MRLCCTTKTCAMPDSSPPTIAASSANTPPGRSIAPLYAAFLAMALLSCAGAAVLYGHNKGTLENALGYGVLPATQSLLQGRGLTICSSELAKTPGNPLCFHAARMPMAEWVMAAAIETVGPHLWRVMLLKMVLLLIPLGAAIYIVVRRRSGRRLRATIVATLLLAPFTMMPFLMQVVRLDYEEAYSYGFVALAFALALHIDRTSRLLQRHSYWMAALAGSCAACVYLAKSSMILFAGTFSLLYLRRLPNRGAKLLMLALSLSATAGWVLTSITQAADTAWEQAWTDSICTWAIANTFCGTTHPWRDARSTTRPPN